MPTNQSYNEKELLQRIAAGDSYAFTILFHQYQHKVYGYSLKLTKSQTQSEDILQEVFFTIWRDRLTLVNIQHFEAYLFGMVRHRILNNFRKQHYENMVKWYIAGRPAKAEYMEDILDYSALAQRATALIEQLPPQQKMVYQLSRQQGMKQEDIAREMGIALTTVKKHLTLALQFIKKHLLEDGHLIVYLLICHL